MATPKDFDKAAKEAMKAFDLHMDQMETYIKETSPGVRRLNDQEFLSFVAHMRAKYLPREYTTPDGELVFESPAVLMLKHGDNTKDDWNRLQRLENNNAH